MDRWGVARAWLYGSVARGDQRPGSDVDLIIELMPQTHIGWEISSLQDDLEDALGCDVDVHGLPGPRSNPAFLRNYERDKAVVYERSAR